MTFVVVCVLFVVGLNSLGYERGQRVPIELVAQDHFVFLVFKTKTNQSRIQYRD